MAQYDRCARAPSRGQTASPGYTRKPVALEIPEKWDRVWPYTDHATERAIGRHPKIRSRSMRGFKVHDHVPRFDAPAETNATPTDSKVHDHIPRFVHRRAWRWERQ
ncbi:MAG: hypothetical protein D6723_00055 [Acidobacteria bacterium]|nr:MAG: hypothetical protein D6723_00055 [Acidobacteriota bacterium]